MPALSCLEHSLLEESANGTFGSLVCFISDMSIEHLVLRQLLVIANVLHFLRLLAAVEISNRVDDLHFFKSTSQCAGNVPRHGSRPAGAGNSNCHIPAYRCRAPNTMVRPTIRNPSPGHAARQRTQRGDHWCQGVARDPVLGKFPH